MYNYDYFDNFIFMLVILSVFYVCLSCDGCFYFVVKIL